MPGMPFPSPLFGMGGIESGGLMALRSGTATFANSGLGFSFGATRMSAPSMYQPLISFTGIAGVAGRSGIGGLGGLGESDGNRSRGCPPLAADGVGSGL